MEEEFQLNEVIQSVKDISIHVAKQNENTLSISIDENIPKILIGDSTRLTQILFNLVGNACKYTRLGKVEVTASLLSEIIHNNCRVLFIISDEGSGISDNQLTRIFNIFTQVNDPSVPYAKRYQGAGLGLPLVKKIVSLFGGNIAISSQKGKGTVVYVSLPFKIPETLMSQKPV
jgi:signal transduction histidine kinase